MRRARTLPKSPRLRNPVARSPLLGKGGVHERSPSSRRQGAQRELARVLKDLDRD